MGLTAVLWNYDTRDWTWTNLTTTSAIQNNIAAAISLQTERKPGLITLQHDTANIPVSLAPSFLNSIIANGMNPNRVASCLGLNPYGQTRVDGPIVRVEPPPAITTTTSNTPSIIRVEPPPTITKTSSNFPTSGSQSHDLYIQSTILAFALCAFISFLMIT